MTQSRHPEARAQGASKGDGASEVLSLYFSAAAACFATSGGVA